MNQSTYTITLPTYSYTPPNINSTGIKPSGCYGGGSNGNLTVVSGSTCTLAQGTYYIGAITVNGTLNVNTTTGTVKVYYTKSFIAAGNCAINNLSHDPSRLVFYGAGNQISINCQKAPLHAYIMDANSAQFDLYSTIYGRAMGKHVTIDTGGILHADTVYWSVVPSTAPLGSALVTGTWSQSYKPQKIR